MKVYFSSSVRAKKVYGKLFTKIYDDIKALGYKHTSNFLLEVDPHEFYQRTPEQEREFLTKMIQSIKNADVCVFEVSLHSLGVGYSVNQALEFSKPVVLLYQKGRKPYLFSAIKNDRLRMVEYSVKNLAEVLEKSLEEAKESIDIRFTFFITPKINQFLKYISKVKKIPRAVYIRSLLQEQMKEHKF